MKNNATVQFLEENMKTIFAYALSQVSNKDDAEDLASEIILAILKSGDKLQDSRAFYGFVWKIAANTYKNFLRKRNKHQYEEINETISATDDFVDSICAREDINLLRRELSLLSKEYRECTIAYYIDGLSCAQTADKLGISLEMTKYYLFKTRKILKEGMGMEREYGEKSYNPAKFNFVTIFSGNYNAEYRNLFNRKLPGNIILSTYYTPMSIRELSLELGVATPYLEDEVLLLETYDLLRKVKGDKYQANLVVFTETFTNEFQKTAEKELSVKLKDLLQNAKKKLSDIRKLGFIGSQLDDNRLLWAFLWLLMRRGHHNFEKNNSECCEKDNLYNGAMGINYGVDYEAPLNSIYDSYAFAGYAGVDEDYAIAFADFGVLPVECRYSHQQDVYKTKLYNALDNRDNASFMVLTLEEITTIESILNTEINAMENIYSYLSGVAANIMSNHVPNHVGNQIQHIVASTIFFRTVGLIGKCAVDSGELFVPDSCESLALYAYKYHDPTADTKNVMCK